jgi:hypothetical protein
LGASVGGIDRCVNRGGGGRIGDGDTGCLTPQPTLQPLPWEHFIYRPVPEERAGMIPAGDG